MTASHPSRGASGLVEIPAETREWSRVLIERVVHASPTLLEGPHGRLRRDVLEVAVRGLSAADPGPATKRALTYDASSDTLEVDGTRYPLRRRGRVLVVGAGKASYHIALALHETLGDRLAGGVVAVRDPDAVSVGALRVVCADHPLPTDRSIHAARSILACVADTSPDDVVITCFTGGSSALSSLPPEPVTPADKRLLHQQLLSSGLPITAINAVRKQVSVVKGGRIALAAHPATVINLTVSDVAGSPLDAVTDPSVQDSSSAAAARTVLQQAELWDLVPASVRAHLERDLPTPELTPDPQTVMLADGATTVAAMARAAEDLGYRPVAVEHEIEGDAEDVGSRLAQRALHEGSVAGGPVMVIGCGGEAVVAVTAASEFGQGGPNQQAALFAAEELAGHPSAAIFLDSDGSDGGTKYAGALVDGVTVERAEEVGVDLADALRRQHSTAACEQLGIAVQTGHTGTNVNDLFVLAIREASP